MVMFKYEVNFNGLPAQIAIPMPAGALLRNVTVQRNVPVLYTEVHPDAPLVNRVICAVGTGQPTPNAPYIGTAMLDGDSFVAHFYDLGVP